MDQPVVQRYDVFLAHHGKDNPVVRQVAEALKARGLQVWLDEWELVPGRPWQESVEKTIENVRSAAVLIGAAGLGPWQGSDMRGCISESVKRRLPVIPVFLPNAPDQFDLPLFLNQFSRVDLREGFTTEGIDKLVWGIKGERP